VNARTSPSGGALLLTDDDRAKQLAARMGPRGVVSRDDPYDVLMELARNPYSTVMLTSPREEMAEFCRAVRRLNAHARLLAVCPPDDRKQAEPLADECCTYPPTRAEMNLLLQGVRAEEAVARRLEVLTGQAMTDLLRAAHSADALQAEVAKIVSRVCGGSLRWGSAEECGSIEPLLSLPGPPKRFLLPEAPVPCEEPLDALLADLHQVLPALQDTAQRAESLHRLAITDHLTGAYNRRYFYHLVDHILRRGNGEHFRATLLLYDIDDFKRYNDEFGHAAGDEILRDTAMLMQTISREQDIVARIGGDEFAVLFWDHQLRSPNSQPLRDALSLSDRFRQAVERHKLQSLGPDAAGTLTISGGLANFPEHGATCRELLRQADRALRLAKTSGKNSIRLVGHEPSSE